MNQQPPTKPAQHLSQYLLDNSERLPDKTALVDGTKRLSWLEMRRAAEPMAAELARRLGERPRIIATLMPNSWQSAVTTMAVWHAGHILLPLDVIYKPLEIEAMLRQVSPALLITDELNRRRLSGKHTNIMSFEEFSALPQSADAQLIRQPVDKQLASLLFTSGTTGDPKIVAHTHQNHVWNIEACSAVWQWTPADSLLLSLRLSHWYGLVMGLFGSVYHGNKLFLQPRFDAEETLHTLASQKITIFTHGPAVYSRLLRVKDADRYDLSSVRLFISGSAALPPSVWHQFKDSFGHEILEVYGTSETGRIASNTLAERRPGSAGRVLPGVRVKLTKNGEVTVKSPGVFPGYYRNEAATKAGMTPAGYWRTGDLGELKDNRIYLKGRRQERIRKSGYTISPRDVEWALYKYPAIKEVHVAGRAQPGADDRLIYWLVTDASKKAVLSFCKLNLPSIWRPDEIIILKKIPRNRSGKPQLSTLNKMPDGDS